MPVIPGSGILDDLALNGFLIKTDVYNCENLSEIFNTIQ